MNTKNLLSLLPLCLSLLICATPIDCEAQFLKKLSKGLEKVNKGLEKANKSLDNLNKSQKQKSEQSKEDNDNSTNQEEAQSQQPQQENATPSTIDHTEETQVESDEFDPIYMRFMQANPIHIKVPSKIISEAHEGIFSVLYDNKYSFWRVTGEELFKLEWESCPTYNIKHEDREPIFNDGVCGVRSATPDQNGVKAIHLLYTDGTTKKLDPSYTEISHFKDGLAIVRQKKIGEREKYFYINTKGEIQNGYPKITGSNDRSMRPLKDNRRVFFSGDYNTPGAGCVDSDGTVVIPPGKFKTIEDFSEGYAWALDRKEKKWVLINTQGRVVLDMNLHQDYYKKPSDVKSAMFYINKANSDYTHYYTYYDLFGNVKGSCYSGASFHDGLAYIVPESNSDVTIVDRDFLKQSEFDFDTMQPCEVGEIEFNESHTAIYNDGGKSYILSPSGILIKSWHSKKDYDHIVSFDNYRKGGYARVNEILLNDKYYTGFMNLNGELVLIISEIER